MIARFTLRLFSLLLTFLQVCSASVEEGWRYQDSFALRIVNGSVVKEIGEEFLQSKHTPMAYIIDKAKTTYTDSSLPSPEGRLFAMFRFTPLIGNIDGAVSFGETVSISNMAIEQQHNGVPPGVQGYE